MEQYVQNIRIKQWAEIIKAANESGVPRMQWLKENNITKDAFYYWLRKVRAYWAEQQGLVPAGKAESKDQKLVEVPDVKPVVSQNDVTPAAIIRIGSMSIEINASATSEFMEGIPLKGKPTHNLTLYDPSIFTTS